MKGKKILPEQKFYAIPDKPDHRDLIFKPALFDVPQEINLEEYIEKGVPVLNQEGEGEGACTGFALATVCHYLLRRRKVHPDKAEVSARMLYKMAKRTNEWPGDKYKGQNARATIKGWYKHGVSSKEKFNTINNSRQELGVSSQRQIGAICEENGNDFVFTDELARDATKRPLGAYYRVNNRSLTDMHAALAEVGILYATAILHSGWHNVGKDGIIEFDREKKLPDAHAFAIVAYDEHGFWIQNSLGANWGRKGFAHLSYNDWGTFGMDVWAVEIGVPVAIPPDGWDEWKFEKVPFVDYRPHIISIENNGKPATSGDYATNAGDIYNILTEDIPNATQGWSKKRILLYAHGGATSRKDAIQWIKKHRYKFMKQEIFPLIFAWENDFAKILEFITQDENLTQDQSLELSISLGAILTAIAAVNELGLPEEATDLLTDMILRDSIGEDIWDETKENAKLATTLNTPTDKGAARLVLQYLNDWMNQDPLVEVHVAGHSAGSVLLGPLVQKLATNGAINGGSMNGEEGHNKKISSCTLWAPACSITLFKETYLPVINQNGNLNKFALFTLYDSVELDDTVGNVFGSTTITLYNKSMLYMVSNAFEDTVPGLGSSYGVPLLGMQKYINSDPDLQNLLSNNDIDWILANNPSQPNASTANHHGDFSHDIATLEATIARILAV